jgi:transposase
MKRRQWSAEEKRAIVISGLRSSQSVSDICREHQITQSQYYAWRDQSLEGGLKGLSGSKADGEHQQRREVERLEQIIGKQTVLIETLKKCNEAPQAAFT